MKTVSKNPENKKVRPYWHVDAKWICGLLLSISLVLTLPIVAAYHITSKKTAVELITYTYAGMTSPQGIDSPVGLEEIKNKIAQTGTATINFAGVDVVFNAQDVNTLSPRELRLKVFRTFAEKFYDQGIRKLASNQGIGQEATAKLEKDASVINVLSPASHRRIQSILLWMAVLNVVLFAGIVTFSHRFGKLLSPGIALLAAGLPGIPLAVLASQNAVVQGSARIENPENYLEMLKMFSSYITPLLLPHVSRVYTTTLLLGGLLVGMALLGRLVYAGLHMRKKQAELPVHTEGSVAKSDL